MTVEVFKRVGFALLVFLGAGVTVSIALALVPDYTLELDFGARMAENLHTLIAFDYGYTESENMPIGAAIWHGGVRSLMLIFGALVFALVFGLSIGILAGLKRDLFLIKTITGTVYAVSSVPVLVWAAVVLALAPQPPTYDVFEAAESWGAKLFVLLLPVAVLALGDGLLADLVRTMREEAVKAVDQEYIRAIQARGVPLGRHLFRSLVGPAASILAGRISYLISGGIVVEFVFGWRGLAFQTLEAVRRAGAKDYPLILAQTMLFVGIVLLLNLASDLTALFADPRLRKS